MLVLTTSAQGLRPCSCFLLYFRWSQATLYWGLFHPCRALLLIPLTCMSLCLLWQVDKIEFRKPVAIGDLVRLKSRVIYSSDDPLNPTAQCEVICQVVRPERYSGIMWLFTMHCCSWYCLSLLLILVCFFIIERPALWAISFCLCLASKRAYRCVECCRRHMNKRNDSSKHPHGNYRMFENRIKCCAASPSVRTLV